MEVDNYKRLSYLDVYKGIAIIFIIITHYKWTENQRLELLFPFWIDMAVPVFMIITGYVSAMSMKRKGQTLCEAYRLKEVICKWIRFIIPFSVAYIVELIYIVVFQEASVIALVKLFITGGYGPGSYYFPVMLQIVLIFPIIEYIIKRYRKLGLCLIFALNFVYEVLKAMLHMSPEMYRLVGIRYIFLIAYGAFIFEELSYRKDKRIRWWNIIIGIFGFAYIIIFNYCGFTPLYTNLWTTTSCFAVLFIVPVVWLLFHNNWIHCRMLETIGKASFNIFLVQMLYYGGVAEKLYKYEVHPAITLALNIGVCVVAGVVFYKIESPVTRKIIGCIRKTAGKD